MRSRQSPRDKFHLSSGPPRDNHTSLCFSFHARRWGHDAVFEECFCSEQESKTDTGYFQKFLIKFHKLFKIKSGSQQHHMKHLKTVSNKFRQRFPQGNCSTTLTVSLAFQFSIESSMINRFLTSNQTILSSYLTF